jgi:hypothetical protein
MMPLADWSQREHDHQHIHPGCYQEYRSPIASRVIQTIGERHQKGGHAFGCIKQHCIRRGVLGAEQVGAGRGEQAENLEVRKQSG